MTQKTEEYLKVNILNESAGSAKSARNKKHIMKISARNQLKGKVIQINEGSVNSEVIIELAPGVNITSVITKRSITDLDVEVGKEVYAVVKASNVLVGVDH